MTKYKRKVLNLKSEEQEHKSNISEVNDAYTTGAFKYLRLLVHILGSAQFAYGLYYHWFKVHLRDPTDNEDSKIHWGGKFKFLTFLDVILQTLYHSIALVNDIFGSNDIYTQSTIGLRKIKDYIFAALAFPISLNVCISFWVIYAYDRELIFPTALDAIFPNWLNHIVHTNVAMLAVLDLFTCFRKYPERRSGISGTIIFMTLYILWIHVVRYYSGRWAYPLFEILNIPMRYLMLSAMVGFSVLCYILGEYLNNIIWAPEFKILSKEIKTSKSL